MLLTDWLDKARIAIEGGRQPFPETNWHFVLDARVFTDLYLNDVESMGEHVHGDGRTIDAALNDLCVNLRGKRVVTFDYPAGGQPAREFIVPDDLTHGGEE